MTCEKHGDDAMSGLGHCRACDLDNALVPERQDQISNYDRGFRDGRAAALREVFSGMYGEYAPVAVRGDTHAKEPKD